MAGSHGTFKCALCKKQKKGQTHCAAKGHQEAASKLKSTPKAERTPMGKGSKHADGSESSADEEAEGGSGGEEEEMSDGSAAAASTGQDTNTHASSTSGGDEWRNLQLRQTELLQRAFEEGREYERRALRGSVGSARMAPALRTAPSVATPEAASVTPEAVPSCPEVGMLPSCAVPCERGTTQDCWNPYLTCGVLKPQRLNKLFVPG